MNAILRLRMEILIPYIPHIIWAAFAFSLFMLIKVTAVRIILILISPGTLVFIVIWWIGKGVVKLIKYQSGQANRGEQLVYHHSLEGFTLYTPGIPVDIPNPFRGVLIVGGAGSGKTVSIINPIIEQAVDKEFTGLLYDFKYPDLSSEVYRSAVESESPVQYFYVNFSDPNRSHRVNPLAEIEESAYAREMASALISNMMPESIKRPDFFSQSATALLSGAIWSMHRRHRECCTLPHVISLLMWPDLFRILDFISEDPVASDMVASVRSGLESEKQTAGVVSTLQTGLSRLSDPKIFYVLSGHDVSLDLNNPNDPKFLCLGNNASLSDTLSPVLSLITTVALKKMNQPGKQKSLLLLDEAPTIYIPGLDQIPATARSNKVATVFCVQDLSQLEDRYGPTKTDIIISNLANQFWGKTTNPKTANKVTQLFGKKDQLFESYSEGTSSAGMLKNSSSAGVTRSYQQRDRVTVQNMRDLVPGEFYALTVESQNPELLAQMIPTQHQVEESIPPFRVVSSADLERNYLKVRDDIKALLSE